MSSTEICPECQGSMTLYENEVTDLGRTWKIWKGTCTCGHNMTIYPDEYYAELDRISEQNERKKDDGLYHGAVGAHNLVSDADKERCTAKLMNEVWHHYQRSFWLVKAEKIEREWTYAEAESEGWFNYHLKLTRWYPINGGDDCEHYDEEFSLCDLEQVRRFLEVGNLVQWTLWKRGRDHKSMTYSGDYPKGGLDQLLEVFA